MPATALRNSQISSVPIGHTLTAQISVVVSEVTVTNTLTETTAFSFTLPGNILGINDAFKIDSIMIFTNTSGGTHNITTRVYLGATAVFTLAVGTGTGSTNLDIILRSLTKNVGATNSQKTFGDEVQVPKYATSAIDTTVNQVVKVTYQWDAALTTLSATHLMTRVDLYRNN